MGSTSTPVIPAPPSLIKALMAGFDATSGNVGTILFCVTLDLFLWLGPRLGLGRAFQEVFSQSVALAEFQEPQVYERIQETLSGFNLFGALRSFPIGVPSLMAGRIVAEGPGGVPYAWQVPNISSALGLWLVLTVLGLVAGSLYFIIVAQAALSERVSLRTAFVQWPGTTLQILLLTAGWFALFLMFFVPFTCLFSILLMGGFGFETVAVILTLVFAGLVIWLLIPLFFSPHGIVVNQRKAWVSVRESVRLTRLTLPSTTLLLLSLVLLSQGLDILWNIPPLDSWWTLVGIIGHAFVTTSLLAASFIYYRDADRWVQRLLQQAKLSMA
jgi:hypothetical protein